MKADRFAKRVCAAVAGLMVMLVVVFGALPAHAASDGVDIGGGVVILGGNVTCPGASVRHLDSTQAAAFVQSWLPSTIFGHLANEKPPSSLPICHLAIGDRWNSPQSGELRVNYATDGTNVWVGMPPQNIAPGVAVASERWIRAPFADRTSAAFNGHGTLIPIATPSTGALSPTTISGNGSTPRSHGSSVSGWLVGSLIVAAVVVVAGVITTLRRKHRNSITTSAHSK